ncbi:MAG: UDP-3-O-(3-hydroxymyristoyl)glucosamine N-acyltransferase [Phycisphaerae bacterium]|nr:UDP-3-O-(3-hydroxymyristoyl)glucosamine N-acyltransferase [Phycisphaerae bacterium]
MPETLAELSRFLESQGLPCLIDGDGKIEIHAANTLEDAGPGEISFLANRRYIKHLTSTKASAVVVSQDQSRPDGLTVLRCAEPYAAIAMLIVRLHGYREHPQVGIHPGAVIHPSAKIGDGANIQHGATIAGDVVIGRGATIYPGCYIGPRCRIGDDLLLMPNVVVYDDSVLGDRVTLHAGTVIGNDGLGYAPVGEKWHKIPQAGHVEIGDDVEIGSNCSIDRATLGKTVIGAGTKMSNLIAIGHGTKIGENCMLVAQAGLAGSVTVGKHVTLAGQVGVVGHITIGDNATVAAKAGVASDVPPGQVVLGQPALPIRQKRREIAILGKLPGLWDQFKKLPDRVKRLERHVAELTGRGEEDADA